MKTYKRTHHQRIAQILSGFNNAFLCEHEIYFGGGTRIAMELDEYRESTDIDFFCHSSGAYKAVRSQVNQHSLGELVVQNSGITLMREIRADRDAVRTFVKSNIDDTPIKLEFIHFDLSISGAFEAGFDVPIVSRAHCYTTKLLANADRYMQSPPKDIFDLCMMKKVWGEIPTASWNEAANCYGEKTIISGLKNALVLFKNDPKEMLEIAVNDLKIEKNLAEILVLEVASEFLNSLS